MAWIVLVLMPLTTELNGSISSDRWTEYIMRVPLILVAVLCSDWLLYSGMPKFLWSSVARVASLATWGLLFESIRVCTVQHIIAFVPYVLFSCKRYTVTVIYKFLYKCIGYFVYNLRNLMLVSLGCIHMLVS